MKVVQINSVCGVGSTGKICVNISQTMNSHGIENYVLYAFGNSDYPQGIKFADDNYIHMQALNSRLRGNYGFNSNHATRKLLNKLHEIQPDIVHIHNIHGHDCNVQLLCEYLSQNKIKVLWTFHDCWTFTGYCTHFTMVKCDRWKTGCFSCPQRKTYSWLTDKSTRNQRRKMDMLTGVDMEIITPSQWLADMVRNSFLQKYPIHVLNNGIDLDVFKPTSGKLTQKYVFDNKIIIMGCSTAWCKGKGIDVFAELAVKHKDDYQIMMVGTTPEIDNQLPDNVIKIHRTNNQHELAELYSLADIFLNPTREDTFPTVNMEAIACGTPVVTFRTGGSPEMVGYNCGKVVDVEDIEGIEKAIYELGKKKAEYAAELTKYATRFDMYTCFEKYVKLYEKV